MGFWRNKRVLVSGANGFLGGWLCKKLVEKKAKVFGLSRGTQTELLEKHGIQDKVELHQGDIVDAGFVQSVFEKTRPSHCFHLAAVASPGLCEQNPFLALRVNLVGAINVFVECAKRKIFVVAASSGAVYGNQRIVDESSPLQPATTYGFTKAKMEEVLQWLVHSHQLVGVIARPTNIFGPLDSREQVRFIPTNIRKALKKELHQNDPNYVRDFVFVEDVGDAFLKMGEKAKAVAGEAFNISAGKHFWGKDLEFLIKDLVAYKKARSIKPLADQCIKNQKARNLLDWKPRYGLVQGIEKTIEWYRKTGV